MGVRIGPLPLLVNSNYMNDGIQVLRYINHTVYMPGYSIRKERIVKFLKQIEYIECKKDG